MIYNEYKQIDLINAKIRVFLGFFASIQEMGWT